MSISALCRPERSEGPYLSTKTPRAAVARSFATLRTTGKPPLYSRYFSAYREVTKSGRCMHGNARARTFLFTGCLLNRCLRAAHQLARPLTRQLVVAHRLDAGVERMAIALGELDQAAAAGGEVVDDFRTLQVERIEVDDVDVG